MNNFSSIINEKKYQERINPNDCLKICPSCSRWVDKTDAHSIFDFKIKICKRCALHEKTMPKFNWINELKGIDINE